MPNLHSLTVFWSWEILRFFNAPKLRHLSLNNGFFDANEKFCKIWLESSFPLYPSTLTLDKASLENEKAIISVFKRYLNHLEVLNIVSTPDFHHTSFLKALSCFDEKSVILLSLKQLSFEFHPMEVGAKSLSPQLEALLKKVDIARMEAGYPLRVIKQIV